MVIAPSKTCGSNFIHHDFVQFGKQHIRTVARKFSIGGLCGSAGGFDIIKLTKAPLISSVSRFNLGGLGALFGGISPPKAIVTHRRSQVGTKGRGPPNIFIKYSHFVF